MAAKAKTTKKPAVKASKKTAKRRTFIGVVLDETSSMQSGKLETIQGYNVFLHEMQQDKGDEVLFSLTKFNSTKVELVHDAVAVNKVPDLTVDSYLPQGWTPLHDAIGKTVRATEGKVTADDLVIFMIMTDGEENSSKEWTKDGIKKLVEEKQGKGWKFIFLGADIDAYHGGGQTGMRVNSTANYARASTVMTMGVTGQSVNSARAMYATQGLTDDMKDADYSVLSDAAKKKIEDEAKKALKK